MDRADIGERTSEEKSTDLKLDRLRKEHPELKDELERRLSRIHFIRIAQNENRPARLSSRDKKLVLETLRENFDPGWFDKRYPKPQELKTESVSRPKWIPGIEKSEPTGDKA